MSKTPHPATDLALCAFILAVAALLLVGASSLPPPRYDPLGSAAFPRALGVLLIVLALPIAAGAVRRLTRCSASLPFPYDGGALLRGGALFLLLIVFIAAMAWFDVTFWIAGTIFVAVAGALIGGFGRKQIAVSTIIGLVLCAGLAIMFSRYFHVDLP